MGDRGGDRGGGNASAVSSVFFSKVPATESLDALRSRFERLGPVVGFRVVGAKGDSVFGFCDYTDKLSAADAVRSLNNFSFGEAGAMRVTHADRKRPRAAEGGPRGGGPGAERGPGGEDRRKATEAAMRAQLLAAGIPPDDAFSHAGGFGSGGGRGDRGAGAFGGIGGGASDPLLQALYTGIGVTEAYEAIEQLRSMAVEHPAQAEALLAKHPQLAVAAVVILQHASRLPTRLPPEASMAPLLRVADGAPGTPQHAPQSPGTFGAAGGAPLSPGSRGGQAGRGGPSAEVLALLDSLSEEDIERVVSLTPAQLANIANPAEREAISNLQRQLQAMAAAL